METGSTSTQSYRAEKSCPLFEKQASDELPRAHCSDNSARSGRSMAIVFRAPTCGIGDLLSSAMETGTDFRHTVRLCATMLVAITRSTNLAATRLAKDSALEEGRLEVVLGWPFTSAEQRSPTSICLSSEEAAKMISSLEASLRRLSAIALGATMVDVSALALSSSGRGIDGRESVDAETNAMKEVVTAYTVGGGVWPGTGLRVFRPRIPKPPLMERVLLRLRDCGEGGRAVLDARAGYVVVGSPSASASMLLVCAETGTDAPPLALEEAPASNVNNVAETLTATSDTFDNNGGRSPARTTETDNVNGWNSPATFSEVEVTSKSLPPDQFPAQECVIIERCPQAASTSSDNEAFEGSNNESRWRGNIAAGSLAEPEDESLAAETSPHDATMDPRSTEAPTQRQGRFDTTSVISTSPTSSNHMSPRLCTLPWSQRSDEHRPNGAKSKTLNDPPVVAIADAQKNVPGKSCPSSDTSTHEKAATTPAPIGLSRVELEDHFEDKASASCGDAPQITSSRAASPESRSVPTAINPFVPPCSPSPSMSLRLASKVAPCQVGAVTGRADEPGNGTSPSPTRRRRRRSPIPSRSPVHSGGGGSKLTLDTAATTSCQKSAAASSTAAVVTPPAAADAVEAEIPSSSSPGRRRVSSSPRGRPSCSPRRSPSRSPARSRGSTTATSPCPNQRNVTEGNLATAENSFIFRPPPPDLQRSCYDNMGGLPGFLGRSSRVGGVFGDDGGSMRCRSSINHMVAMNAMLSPSSKAPLSNERDTTDVFSTSSPSTVKQQEEVNANHNNTKGEEKESAAAAAAAAAARKAARRVTWDPMVLARCDADAVIRPFVQRHADAKVQECRAAHHERETWKFIERQADRERGHGRPPAIARPAAQRGAFFGLLSSLHDSRSTWRKYMDYLIMERSCTAFVPLGLTGNQVPKVWGGDGSGGGGGGSIGHAMARKQESGTSAPPGPVNLGGIVRQISTNLFSRGT